MIRLASALKRLRRKLAHRHTVPARKCHVARTCGLRASDQCDPIYCLVASEYKYGGEE